MNKKVKITILIIVSTIIYIVISQEGFYPFWDLDHDKDGLVNSREKELGTLINDPDSDDDGLIDGYNLTLNMNSKRLEHIRTLIDRKYPEQEFELFSIDNPDNSITLIGELDLDTDPLEIDADGDYISDAIEIIVLKTNYQKIDSDGDGFDDFNEVYTWSLDPNNPEDGAQFFLQFPNVEARHWSLNDGNVHGYSDWKYEEISLRDPYISWLAERSEIKWDLDNEGNRIGKFYVNGELSALEYGDEGHGSIDQPSFYFSHRRMGVCVDSSLANVVILKAMGLQTRQIHGRIPFEGELTGHAWVEVTIEGHEYIVNFGALFLKEGFYEKNGWIPN